MMAPIAYSLGVSTSILCAFLLIRSYRAHKTPLLLWSSLCFVGLALNNVLLFVDLFVVPDVDLLAQLGTDRLAVWLPRDGPRTVEEVMV